MNLAALLQNKALIAGLVAWVLAQVIKIPLDYLRTRRWNWALLFTTGGMPSSHSALMTASTGPKISSRNNGLPGGTPVKIVGGT